MKFLGPWQSWQLCSQNFIFFASSKCVKKLECLSLASLQPSVMETIWLIIPICEFMNKVPGVVFTKLHFLCYFQMPNKFECSSLASLSAQSNVTIQLIVLFCEFRRKLRVVNKALRAVFTKLHFLCYFQMCQKARVFVSGKSFSLV